MNRPILQSQFFKDHAPERDFYRRFQSHYAWNTQVLPVYEWEGLLFIASDSSDLLETRPTEWPNNWVLVEANSADLENVWAEFKESTSTGTGVSLPGIPDLSELVSQVSEIPDLDEPSLHEAVSSLKIPDLAETKLPSTPVMEDLESLMSASESTSSGTTNFGETPEDASSEMLEGISMTTAPVTLGRVAEPMIPADIPLPGDDLGPVPEDTLPPTPRASILKMHSAPEVPQVPIQREIDELTPTPPPLVPTPLEEVGMATAPIKIEIPLGDVPHEERLLIDQLPHFYSRGFLALKAGNSMRVVSWPRAMSGEIATKDKDFSLNTPSPFRIVVRTEKPYHGYLIQTSFMTQVFATLNGGQYPETLTVVSVKHENEIVGFVVCFGNKDAEKKAGLQSVERVAEIISAKWKKIGAQFTPAA